MHLWFERKIPESADANIHQTERRMLDYDVAAAFRTVTALADVAAFKPAKKFLAFGDAYVFFLSQSEPAHRRGGITPAVLTMAVAHLQRITAHLDLYRSTVTPA
jgi:hypothetical protein